MEKQIRLGSKLVTKFYDTAINYLERWENSFGGAQQFDWVMKKRDFKWEEVVATATLINQKFGGNKIDIDCLMDEYAILNSYQSQTAENSEEPDVYETWKIYFSSMADKHCQCPNLLKVVEYVLSVPGTSSPVERIFSIMNNIWTDSRNSLKESTVRALLYIKINSGLTCAEFYSKIRKDKDLLKKVISSKKYEGTSQ